MSVLVRSVPLPEVGRGDDFETDLAARRARRADRHGSARARVAALPDADRGRALAALFRRYELQQASSTALPHRRALTGCGKWVARGKEEVVFSAYPGLAKGKIHGLQSCASPWVCPVCAAKIAERRVRHELEPGLARARELNWGVVVLTWTVPHRAGDDLTAMYLALRHARKRLYGGKAWMRARARWGIRGTIRALETTYGVSGWHPHFHELILTARPLTKAEQHEMRAWLSARWQESCVKAGLACPSDDQGCRLSAAHDKIEQYVEKQRLGGVPEGEIKRPRWDYPQELAKQPVKAGRTSYKDGEKVKGYSPFELLAILADEKPVPGISVQRACDLWREYDAAITGCKMRALYWSPGLKAELGVAELTDEQIESLEDDDHARETWDTLRPAEWDALRADGKRNAVLTLLPNDMRPEGDRAGLASLLAPYKGIGTRQAFQEQTQLVLDCPAADERDRWPVVGAWQDPLAVQFADSPACGEHIARSQRERWGRGEPSRPFEERLELADALRAQVPEIMRPGSPLGPIHKKHGRAGVWAVLAWLSLLAPPGWDDAAPDKETAPLSLGL